MKLPDDFQTPSNTRSLSGSHPATLRKLGWAAIIISICFGWPLYLLVVFALKNDLYSHVILIPLVSLYLIWIKRASLPGESGPDRISSIVFVALGTILLATALGFSSPGGVFAEEDHLAPHILAFVFFLFGAAAWIVGRAALRVLAFPLGFLIFMVPFPGAIRTGLETFLQYGSAEVAHLLFKVSGTTVLYHDLMFRLPGINLEVAPECSGIRSSLALLITSTLAGYFFLRTPWKCAVLTAAVIPLAILRNGFRIFTIGELCVNVSPDMINSPIHHQGGPIFFALSLIPFFLLLRLLLKLKAPSRPAPSTPH